MRINLLRTVSSSRLLAVGLLALPAMSQAHTGADAHLHMGFLAGFVHPLTGFDHLAAMLSVGVWSALAARRAGLGLLWGPLGFAVMLLAGAVLGLQGVHVPAVEPVIAASLLLAGLLVISRWHVSGVAAALLVGVFAVFHGLAHGYGLASDSNAALTLSGMMAATLLLHAIGLCAGWALRSANVWVPRAAGAGVALFGVALLVRMA